MALIFGLIQIIARATLSGLDGRESEKEITNRSPIKASFPQLRFPLPRFHFLDQTVCFQINQQKIIVLNKSPLELRREFIKVGARMEVESCRHGGKVFGEEFY